MNETTQIATNTPLPSPPPYISLFETFAIITITKPLRNEIGETLGVGLKLIYKFFEMNRQKGF